MKAVNIIILIIVILIGLRVFFPSRMSGFHLSPMPVTIQGTGKEPSDFWNLPLSMKAVPGPSKDAEYYVTDNPGAIVGGSRFVNQQIKNYKLV
jgi:hypothetical protein